MLLLGSLVVGALALVWWFGLAWFLQIATAIVGGRRISLLRAALVVLLAHLAQSFATGLFAGTDGGLVGVVVGATAWTLMHTWLTGTSFGRSLAIGVVMALLLWIAQALAVVLGVLGVGAALLA
jgi:hypothetical protein